MVIMSPNPSRVHCNCLHSNIIAVLQHVTTKGLEGPRVGNASLFDDSHCFSNGSSTGTVKARNLRSCGWTEIWWNPCSASAFEYHISKSQRAQPTQLRRSRLLAARALNSEVCECSSTMRCSRIGRIPYFHSLGNKLTVDEPVDELP